MHIILEGVDKSGKSTLARFLSKELGMPIHKVSAPKGNPFIEYVDLLMNTKVPTIFDRFYLGENVYGPIKRGRSRLDLRNTAILEMLCLGLKTYNIYTYDKVNLIAKRFKEDGETFLTTKEIPLVLNGYMKEINKSILKWHTYKIGNDMQKIADDIYNNNDLHTYNTKKKLYIQQYRTVGDIKNAGYLFVGEKYGPGQNLPLVPFGNSQPGLILYSALKKLKILDKSLVTNMIKNHKMSENSENALIDEISLPGVHTIIALGNIAYDNLNSLRLSGGFKKRLVKVPHPAYACYNRMYVNEYADLIRKVIK